MVSAGAECFTTVVGRSGGSSGLLWNMGLPLDLWAAVLVVGMVSSGAEGFHPRCGLVSGFGPWCGLWWIF